MAKTLETLVVELSADLGSLRKELKVAETSIAQSSRRIEQSTGGIAKGFAAAKSAVLGVGSAIAALGAARIVGSLASLTREAIRQGGELSDLSEQVGLTAEEYQAFQFAIRNTGGQLSAVSPGLSTFSKQLSELRVETGTLFEFLRKTDPAFAGILKGTTDSSEALDLFADRIAALELQSDRIAMARAAFGRGGVEFVNALSLGSSGLAELTDRAREVGAVLGNETVKRADELEDALGNLAEVARTQFASAAIDATGAGQELLDELTDPETIRRVGELAGQIGDLASILLRAAAAFGRMASRAAEAFSELRNGQDAAGSFGAFDKAIEEARRRSATVPKFGTDAEGQTILLGQTPRELPTQIKLSNEERRRLGILPEKPKFQPRFSGGGGEEDKQGSRSSGRDPLAVALSTLRLEQTAQEQVANDRQRFEREITRALEDETLSRRELIEREAQDRIAEMERLGIAGEQAAALRVKVEETASAKIAELGENSFDRLAQIGELAFETIGDAIGSALVGDAELSFDQLVTSFGRTLLRMQIAAAASNIGEILREKLSGATSASSASGIATGSLGILGTIGKLLGFREGGIVSGPVLAAIGEDPATRPEVVAPLSDLQRMIGSGGAEISVVNAIPAVRASARRVEGRTGRDAFEIQLESALGALLARGVFRDQLGGRHAPGMS